jgi:dihydroflavonol-4-reductase
VARVFITGASGFVGGALLDALCDRGDEVVALARSEASATALRARGAAEIVRGDLLDGDALSAGMAGCELLFHVAGVNTMCPTDPAAMMRANVDGAAIAVRAAARAGVGRVVYTSSAAALGEAQGTIGREDSPHRGWFLSHYERSKHDGELAALAAARESGVELVAVNPSSVQGPGRAGGTGKILLAYLNGKLKAFIDTRLSLVDVRDCTAGHLLAAERGTPGARYVLNGVTLTSLEALAIISELTGIDDEPRILPARAAAVAGTVVEGVFRLARRHPPVCREMVRTMLHGHHYDGSRATRELGLEYTPIRETLADAVAWALDAGLLHRPLPGWRPAADRVS